MPDDKSLSRRSALTCMAFGSAGTLFALSGGIFTPIDLAVAAEHATTAKLGKPLFVQISDTHIGFNKETNSDVNGTLNRTVALVNAMSEQPALTIHTGDITHLSSCDGPCQRPSFRWCFPAFLRWTILTLNTSR